MAQSALAAGATQINLLINLAIASFLAAGSISWLHYADRLMELPAGLLGAALATVALPALAKSAPDKQSDIIDGALTIGLVFSGRRPQSVWRFLPTRWWKYYSNAALLTMMTHK